MSDPLSSNLQVAPITERLADCVRDCLHLDDDPVRWVHGRLSRDALAEIERLTASLAEANANANRLTAERDRLRAALDRAHAVIRKCVTAGVLRADLNQFLADEAEYRGPPDETSGCVAPARAQHGRDCPKVQHVGEGYLHAADDDRPYEVDGLVYCGRCHGWLDRAQGNV